MSLREVAEQFFGWQDKQEDPGMSNVHDRIVTPDTDPDRFTEEEAALFRAGKCGYVIESGNWSGIVHCKARSRPGASFGNCAEHEAELLEDYWPDGTSRWSVS